MLTRNLKYFGITLVTVIVGSEVIFRIYKAIQKRTQNVQKIKSKILFSSEESQLCKPHLKSGKACNRIHCPIQTINELKSVITSATESLDVCVYFLTNPSLLNAIVEVFNKNVPVRIITDADMSDNTSSTEHIYKLRKQGIRVRTKQSFYYMHHKFAVIDKKIVITGSSNWTKNGFFGNFENIIITSHPEFAEEFSKEFERLWQIFDAVQK